MAGRDQEIAAPRVPALELSGLEQIDADRLQPGASLSYIRLEGARLGGRDLTDVSVIEAEWSDVNLDETNVSDALFAEIQFVRVTTSALRARKAQFRGCDVSQSRIGAADFFAANLRTVRFRECKIGYLSFGGAQVRDVVFEDCVIDELDLTGATVDRLAFLGSKARTVNLAVETARHLDLRTLQVSSLTGTRSLHGVVIDEDQLTQFAPLFAGQLGARIA